MKKKILVVHDNREILELITTILEDQGHEVIAAEDGISALDLLASFTPDDIFFDLVMPLVGGVAHDLNNILSGIVSYPDLLLMDLRRKPLKRCSLDHQEIR